MKSLPAEVLLEMNNGFNLTNSLGDKIFDKISGCGGHYNPITKSISIPSAEPTRETVVHEFGHFKEAEGHVLEISFWDDEENLNTYKKENEEYLNSHETYTWWFNTKPAYATRNKSEMFAECYTLLMLGYSKSKDTIIEHFPNTLRNLEKYLKSLQQDSN